MKEKEREPNMSWTEMQIKIRESIAEVLDEIRRGCKSLTVVYPSEGSHVMINVMFKDSNDIDYNRPIYFNEDENQFHIFGFGSDTMFDSFEEVLRVYKESLLQILRECVPDYADRCKLPPD